MTFGANANYYVESFYKEELSHDLVRVDVLFQKAMKAGMDMQVGDTLRQHWLGSQVGPLGISKKSTEGELISCLRNGLILCKVINKIYPKSVPKVVDNPVASQSFTWDSQPLSAFQYFENIRNFLDAAEEQTSAFEASELERESVEMGSTSKVVDYILSLKALQELKQTNKANGSSNRHLRSPLLLQ